MVTKTTKKAIGVSQKQQYSVEASSVQEKVRRKGAYHRVFMPPFSKAACAAFREADSLVGRPDSALL